MKILAIDPGYERLGIAVVSRSKNNKEKLLYSDCLLTSKNDIFHDRLFTLATKTEKIIDEHKPKGLVIEKVFFNTNQKTSTMISEIKGALILLAMKNGMKIFEYTPLQIKTAVTGYGRSPKEQVISMVQQLIDLNNGKKIIYDDEYDAIAIALTHFAHHQRNLP